jgi:hypothetical protein
MNSNQYNTYVPLNNQPQDIQAKKLDKVIQGYPLTLINRLPLDIIILQEILYSDNGIREVGILKAHGILKIPDNQIKDGDTLHFQWNNKGYKQFVCPSHRVIKRLWRIFVGTVVSYTKTYKRDWHPGGDVSSINIHNLLPWPIIVYTNDSRGMSVPIVYVERNVDLGNPKHHGDLTVSPSVYFDNLNQGLKLGTKFDVFIDNRQYKEIPSKLYSFVLDDIDTGRIFIGGVNTKVDEHTATGANPDIYTVSNTGRAIFRAGIYNPLDVSPAINKLGTVPEGITGGVIVKGKNAPREDKHRNSRINIDKDQRIRSTIPSIRYKKLSDEGTICGFSL